MSDPTITCPKCYADIKLTESQIRCVIEATAGMYGDLQGIAGRSLQEIEGLEVKAIGNVGEVNGDQRL